MKNIFPLVVILSVILAISCNENDKGSEPRARTRTDSLLNDCNGWIILGMAKMGKLTRAEQTTRRLLDPLLNYLQPKPAKLLNP